MADIKAKITFLTTQFLDVSKSHSRTIMKKFILITIHQKIKTIVIVFSILIILEGILFHFLFQLWSDVLAWIFTIPNIFALLYMIGL